MPSRVRIRRTATTTLPSGSNDQGNFLGDVKPVRLPPGHGRLVYLPPP